MMREISLSNLVVNTRHYIKEFDWYLNKDEGYIYGAEKNEGEQGLCKYTGESGIDAFVLMPELQDYSIEDAAQYLRNWCEENEILFKEDLDDYKAVERYYWGYEEI